MSIGNREEHAHSYAMLTMRYKWVKTRKIFCKEEKGKHQWESYYLQHHAL